MNVVSVVDRGQLAVSIHLLVTTMPTLTAMTDRVPIQLYQHFCL